MKKILINITFIVISVMLMVYLLIYCTYNDVSAASENILVAAGQTGLSEVGFILLFPLFVLTIVTLTTNNKKVAFAKDVIGLFASLFIIAATIITMVISVLTNYYVPVIVLICATVLLLCSAYYTFKAIKEDDSKKKKESEEANKPVKAEAVAEEKAEVVAEAAEEKEEINKNE